MKIRFLLICVFLLFNSILFGQEIASNKNLKIHPVVNIPKIAKYNCPLTLIHSIDSFSIFKTEPEGCDSDVLICLNTCSKNVVWALTENDYDKIDFQGGGLFYFKFGSLHCKNIGTGKIEWSILLDNRFEKVDLKLAPNSKCYITSILTNDSTNEIEHYLVEVDLTSKSTIVNKFVQPENKSLLGIILKEEYILLSNYKGGYYLNLNYITRNKTFNLVAIPKGFEVLGNAPSKNDSVLLIKTVVNKENHTIRDSIFVTDILFKSKRVIFVNQRVLDKYENMYGIPRLRISNGILNYLQLDTLEFENRKIKQALIQFDFLNYKVLWRYTLPNMNFNEENRASMIDFYCDSSVTTVLLQNSIYSFRNYSGNVLWKFNSKKDFDELYCMDETFFCLTNLNWLGQRKIYIFDCNGQYLMTKRTNLKMLKINNSNKLFAMDKRRVFTISYN